MLVVVFLVVVFIVAVLVVIVVRGRGLGGMRGRGAGWVSVPQGAP